MIVLVALVSGAAAMLLWLLIGPSISPTMAGDAGALVWVLMGPLGAAAGAWLYARLADRRAKG